MRLSIFVGESDKWHHRSLYAEIARRASRRRNLGSQEDKQLHVQRWHPARVITWAGFL